MRCFPPHQADEIVILPTKDNRALREINYVRNTEHPDNEDKLMTTRIVAWYVVFRRNKITEIRTN